jgi:hypothetical protein
MERQGQLASNWLDRLGQFNFLTALRERNHVRRTCLDTLNLHHEVATELPHAGVLERYERVVALRTGADAAGVARLIPADL